MVNEFQPLTIFAILMRLCVRDLVWINLLMLFKVLGQLPPRKIALNPKPNPNANPNSDPNPGAILLAGNSPDTVI